MSEIFLDSDVQRVFRPAGDGAVSPDFDELGDADRALIMTFIESDQDPGKIETLDMLIKACAAGVQAFERVSDPMPRSWAPGWKKFILYITALNTRTLWARFYEDEGIKSYESAILRTG